ncbi:MAG: glycosyltransferase family 4 protein [Mojavia pulchra JT2-VF2]|jgi:glycosyltransferase involved in cell wall biosynthesis|uniref:Glycosyltransferase family 4 protein n=1 Tax=Mojavia pulchra JT2-VF2 TaxID=287848 RepID=A0A951PY07_9NOST|nr:glycosyltransferase family 4 protein [Mojavia pulchra JT2-VF2]
MRVLFTNNYAMDRTWEQWKKGEHPGNHLWGVTHLPQYGIDVDILPYEKYAILNQIGRKLKLGGYLDQELRIFFNLSQYDLVYSGNTDTTFILSYLRYLGIFKKPIICVLHHTLQPNRLRHKTVVKGHDRLLCLSNKIKSDIEMNFSINQDKLEVLEWGFDLSFYDNQAKKYNIANSKPELIISAGHTLRDYDTLVRSFTDINYRLHIYSSEHNIPKISDIPSNITFKCGSFLGKHALEYGELVAEYGKAYAVAIPLDIPFEESNTVTQIGLTSLLEAMVLGKAVVMTRSKHISIDIEKEGIGIWVDYKDVKGWQQAISYLLEHPRETIEMGKKGRQLCESKYNLESFSSKLAGILKGFITKGYS